jgi:hypothetical protein
MGAFEVPELSNAVDVEKCIQPGWRVIGVPSLERLMDVLGEILGWLIRGFLSHGHTLIAFM